MKRRYIICFCLLIFSFSCYTQETIPVNHKLSHEAQILYENLKRLTSTGIMIGHQDDLAYGANWKYISGSSDIKSVCGDYPAVYGWELGHLELGAENNLDTVSFDKIRHYIVEAYSRGGINTISWHANNPQTGGTSWDVSSNEVVKNILPGGNKHELFKGWLDKLANFFLDLKDNDGRLIPVIFRPYHEQSGSWFWWGKDHCTKDEYIKLWRFTVKYFSENWHLNNILYAYSPTDGFGTKEVYLERYPGDDVIDILGFDSYQRGSNTDAYIKRVRKSLGILYKIAVEKNKIPILAETGAERIPNPDWWTNGLWEAIKDSKIAYVLIWRNAYGRPDHFYAPYAGHSSEGDFKQFYQLPGTLFQSEITEKKLYKK